MSPSRSATTVTQLAPDSAPAARSAPSSQRRLSFSAKALSLRCAALPPVRTKKRASTSPTSAPSTASTAITGCNAMQRPLSSARTVVVSWIASTCRPAARPPVRPAAVSIISSTLTAGLRTNRVILISPARLPPSRRTLTPRLPTATSRACKTPPPRSSRRSPNRPNVPSLIPWPRPMVSSSQGLTPRMETPDTPTPRCVTAVARNGRGQGEGAANQGCAALGGWR